MLEDFSEATLREYGDKQYVVAYVEVNHPIYANIKRWEGVEFFNHYKYLALKGKIVATDFYFNYKKRNGRTRVIKRLEKALGVKLQK